MLESYYKSKDEKNFVLRVIAQDIRCLGNELQELYANANECWWEDVVNYYDSDDEPQDIMQWFIVSNWLAGKLEAIGEPVLHTDSCTLWGRTCCGQSIELDGTIQKIYRNLDIGA
jgi:hypothetical protein